MWYNVVFQIFRKPDILSGKIWNTDFVGKREMISLKQISYSMQCWNPSLSISFMQTTDISFMSTRALECKLHEKKYLSKLDWKMKKMVSHGISYHGFGIDHITSTNQLMRHQQNIFKQNATSEK